LNVYDLIAAIGKGSQLDLWWQLALGTWHPETIAKASKQAAYGSPSISLNANYALVSAINTKNGNLMFWYQAFDTKPWHAELVAKG
jgi:hypothetical protein